MRRRITCWLAVLVLGAPGAGATGGAVAFEAAIGWKLFFDPRLSRPGSHACASCHQPERRFADGLPRAKGVYGDVLRRHTPRLSDLGDAEAFFWDGRAATLEEQVFVPLTHPLEMDLTLDEAVARVSADSDYRRAFAAAGIEEVDAAAIAAALAAFVLSLETGRTRFDRWLDGEADAMNAAEKRGRMIFFTRGQCATCHTGPSLTDHGFHNVGTGSAEDRGRFEVTGDDRDLGRFKTPPLIGWRGSEPFMHDGRFATIEEVLDFYSQPPPPSVGASELDPLELIEADKADLRAFLEAVDGDGPDLGAYEAVWKQLLAGAGNP